MSTFTKQLLKLKHVDNSRNFILQFEYHCPSESNLDLAIGVSNIVQNEQTKQTTQVDSLKTFREKLQPGDKVKFDKSYPMQNDELKKLYNYGIMMRISNANGDEASQYSLSYNQRTKLWKVCVQNFTRQNQIFGIQDIYGGGEQGQQCIICFTQKSTTMVKPCNHLCLCKQCAKVMEKQSNNCPICRKKIVSLVTIRHE